MNAIIFDKFGEKRGIKTKKFTILEEAILWVKKELMEYCTKEDKIISTKDRKYFNIMCYDGEFLDIVGFIKEEKNG